MNDSTETMSTNCASRFTGVIIICLAVIGVWTINSIAEALNSHSADLEKTNVQLLSISDSNQLGLDFSDTLTLELWVKFETDPQGLDTALISKRLSTGNNRSYMLYMDTSSNIEFEWHSDGFTGTSANFNWDPSVGTWYHLAVTKNGTTVKLYVNGVQTGGTQNGSFSEVYDGNASVEIGGWSNNGTETQLIDGKIDDVRVWNIARTEGEIAANMNTELVGDEEGLVGYWKFNGSSLEDATANNNDLTNVNGATFSTDVPFADDPPPTPEEHAVALIEIVLLYELPKNIENAYLAHLKKLVGFIETGKINAALGQLAAFVDKVETHYAEGKLSEFERDQLIDKASTLTAVLE